MLSLEVQIVMDTKQVGVFLALLRKEQGLTQEQLGERLGVSNKTISRWETGIYLPPIDILLMMSELFHISINELLSGKRLNDQEYKKAAEENLTQAIKASCFTLKERIEFYKKKWLIEHVCILIFIGVCILGTFISAILIKTKWLVFLTLIAFVIAHIWRYNTMMSYIGSHAYDGISKL